MHWALAIAPICICLNDDLYAIQSLILAPMSIQQMPAYSTLNSKLQYVFGATKAVLSNTLHKTLKKFLIVKIETRLI